MSLQLIPLEKCHAKLIYQLIQSDADEINCHIPTIESIYWIFKTIENVPAGLCFGLTYADKLIGVFACHIFYDGNSKQTFVNVPLYFLRKIFNNKPVETFFKAKIYERCKLGSALVSKYPCLDVVHLIAHTEKKTFIVPINMRKLLEMNVITELPPEIPLEGNPLIELTKNSDPDIIKPDHMEPFGHTFYKSVSGVKYSYVVPESDAHLVFSVCDFVDKGYEQTLTIERPRNGFLESAKPDTSTKLVPTRILKTAILEKFSAASFNPSDLFKFACDKLLKRGIDQVILPEDLVENLDITKYEYMYVCQNYVYNLN
jgi:hypothetical protein